MPGASRGSELPARVADSKGVSSCSEATSGSCAVLGAGGKAAGFWETMASWNWPSRSIMALKPAKDSNCSQMKGACKWKTLLWSLLRANKVVLENWLVLAFGVRCKKQR
jgi:hypothetical protein